MVVAYLNLSYIKYPFGTHDWHIYHDTCCKGSEPEVRSVSFTVCTEDEFNCASGIW